MKFKKLAAASALVSGSIFLQSNLANAQNWTGLVNGISYDFSTQFGSLNSIGASAFQANPWWGDQTKANTFATAVGTNLGANNINLSTYGAFFAWSNDSTSFLAEAINVANSSLLHPSGLNSNQYTFVFASPTPTSNTRANVPFEFSPEQGFLLGVPLFLGLRQIKKRSAAKKQANI